MATLTHFHVGRHRGDRVCLYPASYYESDFADKLLKFDDLTPEQKKYKVVKTFKNYWSGRKYSRVYVIAPDSVIKENNLEPIGKICEGGLTKWDIRRVEMQLAKCNNGTAVLHELDIYRNVDGDTATYSVVDVSTFYEKVTLATCDSLQEAYDKINEMLKE